VTAGRRRLTVLLLAAHSSLAFAYRPFGSTDASVAEAKELELELGTSYLHEGDLDSLIVPAIVANYGIDGDREIVLEGEFVTDLDDDEGSATRLDDTVLSLKQIHRRGSLQDSSGVSVGSECGVLLPTIHGEAGMGAKCALLVSQRWSAASVHLNGALTFNRSERWEESFGAIVEGPDEWRVRPVSEISLEWESNEPVRKSALVGAIWRANESVSFDVGVRYGKTGGLEEWELRAGVTLDTGR
jgi:hypothetical protein